VCERLIVSKSYPGEMPCLVPPSLLLKVPPVGEHLEGLSEPFCCRPSSKHSNQLLRRDCLDMYARKSYRSELPSCITHSKCCGHAVKKLEDQLFDTMDATDLNKRLKDLMDGLSVKASLPKGSVTPQRHCRAARFAHCSCPGNDTWAALLHKLPYISDTLGAAACLVCQEFRKL
jgi:hypothetical protein